MADRLGGFRTPEDATRYYERYDDLVARTWPVAHEELDVPTPFGPTHIRRSGPADGAPFVLLHPTSGGSLGWRALVASFAAGHPVYTPDTIGTIGRSVQTAPIRSAGDLAVWLDAVLDALALDSIHLVGYSEGGWIAGVHAALSDRPERVATLTLIEPGGAIERISRRMLATMVLRGVGTLRAKDKAQAIRSFNQWLSGDIEITDDEIELVLLAFKTFRQKLPIPGRLDDDDLRRITVPTLLLLGADTRIYDPERVAARARRLLPEVTVEITPGAGHGLPLQFPDRITSRILTFAEAAREPRARAS